MRRIGFVRLISRLAATLLVVAGSLTAMFVTSHSNWPRSQSLSVFAVSTEPTQTLPPPPPIRRRAPSVRAAARPDPEVANETQSPPPIVEIVSPSWLTRPRHPERRYPSAAFAAGIAGEVELDCAVAVDGRLDCTIASETPSDWGFGEAALALASEHVMAPPTQNGAPARGHYRMRIPFRALPH